jgi:predicted restriction endonuclease
VNTKIKLVFNNRFTKTVERLFASEEELCVLEFVA